MSPSLLDTIVALSSAPPGRAAASGLGRAIVRLSGARSVELAGTVFSPLPKEKSDWQRIRGTLRWRDLELPSCAYVMHGPRSYTRQDVVELHLPAIAGLVPWILGAFLERGARAALPGEFTRRALLNGRISLLQADAVGALIRAGTADEARALAQRACKGGGTLAAIRSSLEELLALIELGLDFSQEDVTLLGRTEALTRVRALARRLEAAAATGAGLELGKLSGDYPRVVLAGPTNAGKSSLFNALLGRSEAIVSAGAHTTRDAVEADFEPLPGIRVRLVDSAGFEDGAAHDPLVRQAMDAASRTVRSADILLLALDRAQWRDGPLTWGERNSSVPISAPAGLALLWTKADLPAAPEWKVRAPELAAECAQRWGRAKVETHVLSAANGAGLAELRAWIGGQAQAVAGRVAAARAAGLSATSASAVRAGEALARAEQGLEAGLGEDALAVELREAVHALSAADGIVLGHDGLTENVLDRIFADFCIGK